MHRVTREFMDNTEQDGQHEKEKKEKTVSFVDKRRVGRGDPGIVAHEASLKPTFVEELEARTKLAENRLRERIAELDEEARKSRERVAVDLEKRFAEREKVILLDLLEILDDLDRAATYVSEAPAVQKGLDLITARLEAFLIKQGCEKFSPQGEPFDPQAMEAVQMLPGARDTVVAVFSPSITRDGALLRPARVAVGSGE
jgi:molecular chaperone GrpE